MPTYSDAEYGGYYGGRSREGVGRVRDLSLEILDRLRGHAPLTDRLEQRNDIADGTDVIMPAYAAERWHHDDDNLNPPSVGLAVSTVTASSNRENFMEAKAFTIQVAVEFSRNAFRQQGPVWIWEVLDEIEAVVTRHTPGWVADGVTGGTPEPLWDDDRGRYRAVVRFDMTRTD